MVAHRLAELISAARIYSLRSLAGEVLRAFWGDGFAADPPSATASLHCHFRFLSLVGQ
jgi:hypothetical protein